MGKITGTVGGLIVTALGMSLIGTSPPAGGAPSAGVASGAGVAPIDPDATAQTVALYRNLRALAGSALLFGHQDDLAYGSTWWAESGRSDVLEAAGAYPSVFGWDVGRIELNSATNIDGVDFADLKRWIRQAHAMGAVNTVSWHSVDPVTGGGYGSTPTHRAISYLLPGGSRHDTLITWLDRFADFADDLVDGNGDPIPIVFRPYHEHTGDWFWWGIDNDLNTVADYTQLWRFTVDYLREQKGLHHLLYAISPDRSRMDIDNLATEYLASYPGDEYVDVLGFDNYWDTGHSANTTALTQQYLHYVRSLQVVSQLAQARDKIAALTETGTPRGISDPWTNYLLKAVNTDEDTRRIGWSLAWRNPFGRSGGGTPRPGSGTAADFAAFRQHPFTMFQDRLPPLYRPPAS
ncbi:MAG TPA: glycosyl hydrolase [Catenuloplanes sp.]